MVFVFVIDVRTTYSVSYLRGTVEIFRGIGMSMKSHKKGESRVSGAMLIVFLPFSHRLGSRIQ